MGKNIQKGLGVGFAHFAHFALMIVCGLWEVVAFRLWCGELNCCSKLTRL